MMAPDDPRHGQLRGYSQHKRDGEEACTACKDACALYERRRRKLKKMGRAYRLDARGSVRRIRALQAMGHSGQAIAIEGGWAGRCTILNIARQRYITAANRDKVARVYEAMSMRVPTGPQVERRKAEARAKGWYPPLAWDDIDRDESPVAADDTPYDELPLDEVAIERALSGDRSVKLTKAEKVEATALWTKRGGTFQELEDRTGWRIGRYVQKKAA
jgi:hypothetical protein